MFKHQNINIFMVVASLFLAVVGLCLAGKKKGAFEYDKSGFYMQDNGPASNKINTLTPQIHTLVMVLNQKLRDTQALSVLSYEEVSKKDMINNGQNCTHCFNCHDPKWRECPKMGARKTNLRSNL